MAARIGILFSLLFACNAGVSRFNIYLRKTAFRILRSAGTFYGVAIFWA